jgi:hypothetical protein
MRMLGCVLGIAAVVANTGCGGEGDPAAVAIEASPLEPERARGESVAALESGHHEIRVRRTIAVPDRCRTLSGDLARTGSNLTLRVIARPTEEGRCARVESYLAYTATIEGLAPGQYNLRVIHAYASERRPTEVVLEHPVVVLERSVQVR